MIEDLVLDAINEHRALQKFGELQFLADEVAKIRPEVIVEIGSDAGGTLWLWSKLFPNAKLFCIDLPHGPFSTGIPLDERIPAERIHANSHDYGTKFLLKERLIGKGSKVGKLIDFLFIDGDHTEEGVTKDFLDYQSLVRPGGIIAFHDIAEHPDPNVGVSRFWDKVKRDHQGLDYHQVITHPTNWGGIGIIRP